MHHSPVEGAGSQGRNTATENRNALLRLELCRYLAAHPEAKDTIEGIRQFWLGGQCESHGLESVIDDLVGRGWLHAWPAGGTYIYGLEASALPDVLAFIGVH